MYNRNLTHRFVVAVAMLAPLLGVSCAHNGETLRGSGTIEATTVTVAAKTAGEIVTMEVSEGTQVTAGDVLARIDTTALQIELEQARQTVALYDARLALLRAGARDEDVRQGRAALEQAQQNLDLSQRNYDRIKALFDSGSATSSDLDAARTQYEVARAGESSARAALDKLGAFARPEEIRAAEAQLAGARAAADRVQNHMDDAVVRAPLSGTVLTRIHEPGEMVAPGTPLYRIADLSAVTLTVFVPGPELAHIPLNDSVRVTLDSGDEFSGRVSHIASEAEFTPRNAQTSEARSQLVYAVDVALDNPHGVFKIGMPADAEFVDGGTQ